MLQSKEGYIMKPVSEENRPEENEGQQNNTDGKEKVEKKTEQQPKKRKKKTLSILRIAYANYAISMI